MIKQLAIKIGMVSGGLAVAASLMLSPSVAQMTVTPITYKTAVSSALENAVFIQARATFIQAAYVMIEHEPLLVSDTSVLEEHIVLRQSLVSLRGLEGETAVMTCDVRSENGSRDCGGDAQVVAYAITSGHQVDNRIKLTEDMISGANGRNGSSISIEVSYI